MKSSRNVHCYEYVNHGYESVRDALLADPAAVFQAATRAASKRAESVASELRVHVGALEVSAEIDITVRKAVETPRTATQAASTWIELEWEATRNPRLFPLMQATLVVYPLTATETQLDFSGQYDPPMGPVGKALDAAVGHRIAKASVHRFVQDVARYLRDAVGAAPEPD